MSHTLYAPPGAVCRAGGCVEHATRGEFCERCADELDALENQAIRARARAEQRQQSLGLFVRWLADRHDLTPAGFNSRPPHVREGLWREYRSWAANATEREVRRLEVEAPKPAMDWQALWAGLLITGGAWLLVYALLWLGTR